MSDKISYMYIVEFVMTTDARKESLEICALQNKNACLQIYNN